MSTRANVIDFEAALRHRLGECQPCDGCGESGTWDASGLCPDCVTVARTADGDRQIRGDRKGTLLACGVPERQAQLDFTAPTRWPHDKRRQDLTLDKWTGDPWSVLLTGPTGTGKTMLAVEIGYRFRCQGHSVRFVRASHVPRIFFSDDHSEASNLETAGLLVLDDFGRGHLGRAWSAPGELLAARYDYQLATLITTNLSLRQIAEHDSHAADRLFEGLVLPVTGDSRRELARPEAG